MKKTILALFLLFSMSMSAQFSTKTAEFHWGDNPEWKNADFDDSDWPTIAVDRNWADQNMSREKTYAWYRIHFTPTADWLKKADQKKVVEICVAYVDDADETFLNGKKIGGQGRLPDNPKGYTSSWSTLRRYTVDAKELKMGKDNVVAVRMWNQGDPGGMFGRDITVAAPNAIDGVSINLSELVAEKKQVAIKLVNAYPVKQQGKLTVEAYNPETGSERSVLEKAVAIAPNGEATVSIDYPEGLERYEISYEDSRVGKAIAAAFHPKYILTPKAPDAPRFNMAGVFGVRPGSPVIYRLPVSGVRPMKFSVGSLPEGLQFDEENGVISGSLKEKGNYRLDLVAENAHGRATAQLTIKVGPTIALTPPMGWNSWNCWGLSVSQEKVMASATALIEKGLADYGYSYINVDDAWEAPERNQDGTIAVNEKFPDMKALGDWLHSNGLKFGIYSSPGDYTCGGYLGSIDHEKQDAETYNSWGVDYLKYDWCGYGRKHAFEADRETVASYVRPYLLMEQYLREQPRDIFYSLCQYGMKDVWKWGHAVDANSWRTTGDIVDTWESLYDIGFVRQAELYPYAGPGHWNDPDMLIVGKVGWSASLRDSRLTPDEQYSHISLWALLASNMLIGCDIAQIDDFTINLLCNNEVNAVNQDILGQQAQRIYNQDGIQVWARPLSDGTIALGIFNLNTEDRQVDAAKLSLQLPDRSHGTARPISLATYKVRDLWRQQNITNLNFFLPTHGVRLLKVATK